MRLKRFWLASLVGLMLFSIATPVLAQSSIIEDKKKQLQDLQKQVDAQEKLLEKKRKESATLASQLDLLTQEIKKTQLEMQALDQENINLSEDMTTMNRQLVQGEIKIFDQKLILREALQSVYEKQRIGVLAVLVSSDSLASFLTQLEYLETTQDRIAESVTTLKELKAKLAEEKTKAEVTQRRLQDISEQKRLQEGSLKIQEEAKENMLSNSRQLEKEYSSDLEKSRQEAMSISNEIARLSAGRKATSDQGFIWPVASRRITATFGDQDYRKRFGIAHSAIDIGTPAGTPVKAPADGTVVKVKAPAMGNLSTIAIAHDNGYTTVYLHMITINVAVGAYVVQGQTIGSSGGIPGTPGAGFLTTGAHLHFEVWRDGRAINPLTVLP